MSRSRPGARLAPRPGSRLRRRRPDPLIRIIIALLCVSLALVLLAVGAVLWRSAQADGPAAPAAETERPAPPTPTPQPTLRPAAVTGAPVSQIPETAPPEPSIDPDAWFADAVFIGDSRTDGLRLFSGITTEAAFLAHTGLSIYSVDQGKATIRQGERRVSVLDALAQGTYGKVYLSAGVNELGYFNPAGFAATYGRVIDAVRERQPNARIYIQRIIPVNGARCRDSGTPYYITNEGVDSYNAALEGLCADKDVTLLGVPPELLDDTGELALALTTDGVHFQVEGYKIWLDYLLAHTEG